MRAISGSRVPLTLHDTAWHLVLVGRGHLDAKWSATMGHSGARKHVARRPRLRWNGGQTRSVAATPTSEPHGEDVMLARFPGVWVPLGLG